VEIAIRNNLVIGFDISGLFIRVGSERNCPKELSRFRLNPPYADLARKFGVNEALTSRISRNQAKSGQRIHIVGERQCAGADNDKVAM
jgi:hypothetical protein